MAAATEPSLTTCCSSMQSAFGSNASVQQAICIEGKGNLTCKSSETCLQLRLTALMLNNLPNLDY